MEAPAQLPADQRVKLADRVTGIEAKVGGDV